MVLQLPEHNKLDKVRDKSQAIGEFIEWLRETKKVHLCKWNTYEEPNWDEKEPDGYLDYVTTPIEELLAEFFEVDLKKLEQEKQAILDEIQK